MCYTPSDSILHYFCEVLPSPCASQRSLPLGDAILWSLKHSSRSNYLLPATQFGRWYFCLWIPALNFYLRYTHCLHSGSWSFLCLTASAVFYIQEWWDNCPSLATARWNLTSVRLDPCTSGLLELRIRYWTVQPSEKMENDRFTAYDDCSRKFLKGCLSIDRLLSFLVIE